jgi:hypothetical protein
MSAFVRTLLAVVAVAALAAPDAPGVIKATSPLKLFVADSTQIVRVRVGRFDPANSRLVFDVEESLKGTPGDRTLNVAWKLDPESKWEGVRTLPRLLKSIGPDQRAVLFVNDSGGFWHNKGNTRMNPIAFGFTRALGSAWRARASTAASSCGGWRRASRTCGARSRGPRPS